MSRYARELDLRQLNPDQRGWIQEHLIYTHGRGFVAAPANRVDSGGRPDFVIGNIPPSGPLEIDQSRIYYGELSPDYSVVNTEQPEIDGPQGLTRAGVEVEPGAVEATFNYTGDGGVQLTRGRRVVQPQACAVPRRRQQDLAQVRRVLRARAGVDQGQRRLEQPVGQRVAEHLELLLQLRRRLLVVVEVDLDCHTSLFHHPSPGAPLDRG
ncbi:MAG: UPF0182 family protein [Actinobacteria bacterium]|nr:UPF0182 family protein [Actinomycetota bacterium]